MVKKVLLKFVNFLAVALMLLLNVSVQKPPSNKPSVSYITVAEVNRQEGWFEVWLIPETLRMTVFGSKQAGEGLNIEIERSTQVVVDTVREAVDESLGKLKPLLEALLREKGLSLDDLVTPPQLPKG